MASKHALDDSADLVSNWAEFRVGELQAALAARGLTKSGNKANLVARLENYDRERQQAASAADQENDAEASTNWNELRVVDLQAELQRRGLPKAGKKADLVARLQADTMPPLLSQSPNNGPLTTMAPSSMGGPAAPAPATPSKPKAKRAKKEPSPDVVIDGPLASQLVVHQTYNPTTGETRPRPFVPAPDETYKKKLKRIQKERMFMLDRQKSTDRHGYLAEKFTIAGSTGNLYKTTIGRSPSCDCMDARMRGQKCKHINYALIIILKAPTHLCYQTAFLSNELEAIFANAPVTQAAELHHGHDHAAEEEQYNGVRKPIEGECPICVFDMEPGEELVWCKAACGQNFHKECFEQWRSSKNGRTVTCVYCRSEWQEDGPTDQMAKMKASAQRVKGYQNIGHLPMYSQQGEH